MVASERCKLHKASSDMRLDRSSLPTRYPHSGKRGFEDHVDVPATAARAHEAATEPAEGEAQSLRPNERLHVQLGRKLAFLDARWTLDRAPHASRSDTPAQAICLSKGLD
jgi:hypothetical protein